MRALVVLLPLWLGLLGAACAQEGEREPEDLRLRVLCLYEGAEDFDSHDTAIHRYLEAPANHLGLRFDYHDLRGGPPPLERLARYRGLVTWRRDADLEGASEYLAWLAAAARGGTPALILEGLGAELEEATAAPVASSALATTWAALGFELDADPAPTRNPLRLEVTRKEPTWVESERGLQGELRWFRGLRAQDPRRVLLGLRRRDGRGGEAHAVVQTAQAFFVAPGYLLWQEPVAPFRAQWRVDPFRMLAAAFGLEGLPRLDPTTLTGARVFYSQVDGDGFESLSRVETGRLCADVLKDRILARFPLPVTVGFITAPLEPPERGSWREIARAIFALPHVEPASHTFTHPFDWESGQADGAYATQVKGYRYDPAQEVFRSVEFLDEQICPPDKRVEVVLWSGDCTPPPAAIAAVESLGLVNLNGGETRRDAHYPSLSQLYPYYRVRGGRLQVHATNPNENVFTEGWQGGFDRLRHVRQSWEKTGSPRRTHPADLFYHCYSAERSESLQALEGLLGWVATRSGFFPISASRYCQIVAGFAQARLRRLGPDVFEVRDQGALRTLRFDDEARELDLAASSNVLGAARLGSTLYVHLASAEPARVALRAAAPDQPYLRLATVPVSAVRAADGGLRLEVEGAPWGRLELAGLAPGQLYYLSGHPLGHAEADAAGRLSLVVDRPGRVELALEPRR